MVQVFSSELNRRLDHLSLSKRTAETAEGEIGSRDYRRPLAGQCKAIRNFIDLAFVSDFALSC